MLRFPSEFGVCHHRGDSKTCLYFARHCFVSVQEMFRHGLFVFDETLLNKTSFSFISILPLVVDVNLLKLKSHTQTALPPLHPQLV